MYLHHVLRFEEPILGCLFPFFWASYLLLPWAATSVESNCVSSTLNYDGFACCALGPIHDEHLLGARNFSTSKLQAKGQRILCDNLSQSLASV